MFSSERQNSPSTGFNVKKQYQQNPVSFNDGMSQGFIHSFRAVDGKKPSGFIQTLCLCEETTDCICKNKEKKREAFCST